MVPSAVIGSKHKQNEDNQKHCAIHSLEHPVHDQQLINAAFTAFLDA